VATHTDVDGKFKLENVPSTSGVPVVVQKGRFRRIVSLDVPACTNTALTIEQVRLPKKKSEGDLPKIAVGIGLWDQIECVLRSIGIDESEFGPGGAVQLYNNFDDSSGNATQFEKLLTDATK